LSDLAFPNYRVIGKADPGDAICALWQSLDMTPSYTVIGSGFNVVDAFNLAINKRIKYTPDLKNEWQTARRTAELRTGDCEDFAIIKYASLRNLLPCAVIVGHVMESPHAWCAAFVEGRWLALDCMFDFLTPVSDYSNWAPSHSCDNTGVTLWGREIRLADYLQESQ
jgi:hypothetical protein